VCASHLINGLSLTAIGGKTPLEIWSEKAAQEHDLCRYLKVWLTFVPKMAR